MKRKEKEKKKKRRREKKKWKKEKKNAADQNDSGERANGRARGQDRQPCY